MPTTFFQESESSGDGDKLFATEYLAANKKELGKHFSVTEVIAARSGKGYMVHTEYFICWLWKKSKLAQQFIEALKVYSSTSQGFHLFVELTNKNRDCFLIGVNTDIETRWYEVGNGSYSLTPLISSSTGEENPFLPHALYPPIGETEIQTSEEVVSLRSRKRA